MKSAFSFIEVVIVIILLLVLSSFLIPTKTDSELKEVTNRLELYLKQVRFQAFIDNKYSPNDSLWHKERWTLKFFRCRKSVGGLYYVIYSDTNQTGHPSANESLKDPLTQKYIYSSNSCSEKESNSSYTLLTKKYNISDVTLSCNSTTSLGQLSFGVNGKVYSKLSSNYEENYENEIKVPCTIRITHKNGDYKELVVENITGYIYKK